MLFVSGVAYFAVSRHKDSSGLEVIPRRTTYSSRPGGLKALYKTLEALGWQVKRHLKPLTSPPGDGVLFIVTPERPYSSDEMVALQQWVERGNLLVYAPDIHMEDPREGKKNWGVSSSPACPSFLSPNVSSFRAPMNSLVFSREWNFEPGGSIASPDSDVVEPPSKAAHTRYPLVPLFRTTSATTAAYCKCGRGSVLVLSSAWPLCNQGISLDDNLVIVLNALRHRSISGGIVVSFDEYHHGYGSQPTFFGRIASLISMPAKLALAQVMMGFALMIFAVSRRFGKPIPLVEGYRQRNEYLTSMASLLRRARAVEAVGLELRRRFIEDIAHGLGLPPTADLRTLKETVARRRPDIAPSLEKLLDDSTVIPRTEPALLALTRRWWQTRKDLVETK